MGSAPGMAFALVGGGAEEAPGHGTSKVIPGPLRWGYILQSSAQDWVNGWQLWHRALLQGPLDDLLTLQSSALGVTVSGRCTGRWR